MYRISRIRGFDSHASQRAQDATNKLIISYEIETCAVYIGICAYITRFGARNIQHKSVSLLICVALNFLNN